MGQDTASTTVKLRGLTAKFDNGVKSTTPFYPLLCSMATSVGADEQYGILGSVPRVREWIGDRQFGEPRATDWTIKNRKWEVSEKIEKDDIDDDRLGMYGPRLGEVGKRFMRHPDKVLFAEMIANAESAVCMDGQYFFDTDHSWGDSGSQSNDIGATAATPTAPTFNEAEAAFEAALHQMLSLKDDAGELIHDDVIIDEGSDIGLAIVCPLAYRKVFMKVMKALLVDGGDTNVKIATARVIGSARYSGTKFDLYRTDGVLKPFIFQARKPISRQMKGLNDLEFKDVKLLADARYNLGYGAWWSAVRTTFGA